MKCLYCEQECKILAYLDIRSAPYKHHQCPECHTQFNCLPTGEPAIIYWHVVVNNDHQYAAIIDTGADKEPIGMLIKCWNTKGNEGWVPLHYFNFIPESWKPANLLEKLKLYLPFL